MKEDVNAREAAVPLTGVKVFKAPPFAKKLVAEPEF
jgi:hypothetical protein